MLSRAFMSAVPCPWRILPLFAVLLWALEGCAGMRLYDGAKDHAATATQTQLKEAKVTETVDVALENSRKFLTEAERVANLEGEVRKKRAQLAIAESSRSMAEWLRKRWAEQAFLGFEDTVTAHARLQSITLVEGATRTAEKNRARLKDYPSDLAVVKLLVGTLCHEIEADTPVPATTKLDAFDKASFEKEFKAYRQSCVKLATDKAAVPDIIVSGSTIDAAQEDRASAIANRNQLLQDVSAAKQELADARKELQAAQDAAKSGKSGIVELREKASKVAQAAGKVAELAAKAGLEDLPLDNIKNLAVLLNAISTGQVDKEAIGKEDSPLAKASLAATELPSLAEDAIALLAAGKAPPTNHLILELNHQQILYSRALALSNLWLKESGLHDKKIAALQEQARQYREIQFRLCNYATRKAGKEHQGPACAILRFDNEDKTCIIGRGAEQETINDCVLAKSWRDNYKGSNDPRAKRQLLAALLAHSRALDAQSEVRKINFQIIDVGHRRIVESNRAAIAAWNNLVSVPVDTLAAYYRSGVKPDTIAKATAQLLGLLGIAVGIGVSD